MDDLRRKILLGQAKLPEGWGKSTVGGQTILTAPSQSAQSAAPLGQAQEVNLSEESIAPSYGSEVRTPDMQGMFREEDLDNQYDEIKNTMSDVEINKLINEINRARQLKSYKNKSQKDDDDFIYQSILRGRGY